ncbi:helix-turn-helix domain-containing protein [Taibaiella soli]|uniref:HTH araC/xylS-type domain-containing protein n=1 Tax=Taibaiella soli TaxID=1649169 RepID=A0A2W2B3G1_9BACT|nr:AraC family transcriptional regulator [Taibaiella soli]PZF74834.1 hypothetical protein DN068_01155 [Taibaiella soli]
MLETKLNWDLSGDWKRGWCNAPEIKQFGLKPTVGSLLHLPSALGTGTIEHVELQRSRLAVVLYDCKLNFDGVLNWTTDKRIYCIYFDFSKGVAFAHFGAPSQNKERYFTSYDCLPPPDIPIAGYQFQTEAGVRVNAINVLIEEKFFEEMAQQWTSSARELFIRGNFWGYTAIDKRMFRIFQETKDAPPKKDLGTSDVFFLKANTYRLLYFFLSNLLQERCPKVTETEERLMKLDKKIRGERLDDLPSIDNAAKEVAVCPSKFKELFKKIFCKPYYQYYKEIRLNKATEMLQDHRYNIKEVAIALGYQTTNAFSKAFHSKNGVSPQQFRQKHQLSA